MGLFSSIGDALNSITGAKSSSKDSHKYATAQQKLSFEQQKKLNEQAYAEQEKLLKMQQAYDTEMANTAIQRQMNDYLQTGINPAMVVGGSGAGGGSVSAPSTSGGSSGGTGGVGGSNSGIDILGTMINAYSAKKAGETGDTQSTLNISQANKNDAETAEIMEKLPFTGKNEKAKLENTLQDTIQKRANTAKTMHELETGTLGKTVGTNGTDTINDLVNMGLEYLKNRKRKGNGNGGGR